MASLEEFESTLKDLVQAKRLSASKMTKLTEIALKCIEQDTQLVSILYRTHKSLSAASKINSLYAFDSLARAARHKVNKYNLSTDVKSSAGNCATFLLKIEGILDGLFQSMVDSGDQAAKEKSLKVLDIWTKASTFSAEMIARLRSIVNSTTDQDSDKPTRETSSTPLIPASTTPPGPPPSSGVLSSLSGVDPSVQSKLMALLSQAATKGTLPSQSSTSSQLDPNQLALLQQLTHVAQQGQGVTNGNNGSAPFPFPPPSQPNLPVDQHAIAGPSNSHLPYRDNRHGPPNGYNGPPNGYNGHHGPPPNDGYGHYPPDNRAYPPAGNDYHNSQQGGPYRGGPAMADPRGRGPGPAAREIRRDPRDPRDPDMGQRGAPSRTKRSRSRSPQRGFVPNNKTQKTMRAYSPPRRHTNHLATGQSYEDTSGTASLSPPAADAANLDEFGREIRVASPSSNDSRGSPAPKSSTPVPAAVPIQVKPPPKPTMPPPRTFPVPTFVDNQITAVQPVPPANTSSHVPSVSNSMSISNANNGSAPVAILNAARGPGLDKFDITTFDVTSVESWAMLGNMWRVTNGREPSQEEVMQFYMLASSGMMMQQQQMQVDAGGWPQQASGTVTQGQGQWHGGQQGGRNQGGGGGGFNPAASDAVFLGQQSGSNVSPPTAESSGGKMQNIGGKWVFVKAS